MDAVRAVVIGFGGMGSKYVEMLHEKQVKGMVLAGVCCRNAPGQKVIREKYPEAAVYESVESVFARGEDFDAVVIVTPHNTHVEIGCLAAEAGKHILMDKPAGVSTKEVKHLMEEVEKSGVSFGMIFNTRMKGAFLAAKEFLEHKRLGKITRAVWVCNTWYRSPAYHHSAPWRSTWRGEHGGLLINQCQHFMDIWQWLFGMPDQVYASIDYGKYNDFSVDDCFDLQFFYKNGMRGTFLSASGEHPGTNRLEIWGEKGKLTILEGERLLFDENLVSTDQFARTNEVIYGKPDHRQRELLAQDNTGLEYRMIFQKFADHVLSGRELAADGQDGLNTLMMAGGAYLSSWLEQRVDYPIDDDLYMKFLEEKIREEEKLDSQRKHDL